MREGAGESEGRALLQGKTLLPLAKAMAARSEAAAAGRNALSQVWRAHGRQPLLDQQFPAPWLL